VKESKKQLKRSIVSAESTLQDLAMTVSFVENDRAKFRHIDDRELYDRSSLVNTSRDRIVRAKQEMQSESVKAKLLQDERSKALRRAGATVMGAQSDSQRVNTNMIVDAQARQSLLVQHQDETLDELDMAVTRVNHMAGMMHEEINQQNVILNEMEEDLTNVEEELGMVMGKLAKFLKTKDTWQLGTILCLSLTCIILFLMVLYF
jgi:Syntaxin 6, N-terminal